MSEFSSTIQNADWKVEKHAPGTSERCTPRRGALHA